MDNIRVRVPLPPVKADDDVESVEFSYSVDDDEPVTEELPKNTADKQLVFPAGSNVHLEVVHLDEDGNRTAVSERDFVAGDWVPPTKAGELTVEVIGEA